LKQPASSSDTHAITTRVDQAIAAGQPILAIELALESLRQNRNDRGLLDALVLQARLDMGLPPLAAESPASLPEPLRTQFEDRYIAAIRQVGEQCLEWGDLPRAWNYLRAINELDPIADAIRRYEPDDDDEHTSAVIEIAFHHGVEPVKGFQLLLARYGTCPALSAFEQSAPRDPALRIACVELLIDRVHADLTTSLRSDILNRGQPAPAANASVTELIAGRDWLFSDDSYHIDVSHLASVVRFAVLAVSPPSIEKAVELADYGRRLSPRLRYDSPPPFQNTYADHYIYLNALAGREINAACSVFETRLAQAQAGTEEAYACAQALVNLLARVGRVQQAALLAVEHLAEIPESALTCPTITQLCQQSGRLDLLADWAKGAGDLAAYVAARLASAAKNA